MPDMMQSVISVLDQRQAQQTASNSHQGPQTEMRATAEEQPISSLRDCSLFIGSTGPVFCEKDPWKKFLSRQQNFPKKLVSRQWKEGK